MTMQLSVQRYHPRYQAGVRDLILPIQNHEFNIAITAEQQPDLSDIAGFYQQGSGDFWLALADDRVVGCIGLKDIGQRQAALRKMFVAEGWRGKDRGVANSLLQTLIAHGRKEQLTEIWLGTTAKFLAAHRFYEKNGFSEVAAVALPAAFPLMKVDTKFYHLTL
ncbi:GNAT family N-acetyltransferase [Erwinia phyllosphaerae]|uniref:GNAT family N-acetyltransferase n=1 Tax=Erwinia phyllosphaerae TaxID=2853256 RepID=UPI001FEDB9EF|nr:GNAT family N-acetyltransferase [Erwinia phyllosphaerae]MBV4367214.1 GNAT family N-acetyltransferase [Erwinia phyllosphaerae]